MEDQNQIHQLEGEIAAVNISEEPEVVQAQKSPVISEEPKQQTPTYKCWEAGFYQPYFDLSTSSFLLRVKNSVWPFRRPDEGYFGRASPDLYGPFWIASTLVFLLTAVGKLSNYTTHTSFWDAQYEKLLVAFPVVYVLFSAVPVGCFCLLSSEPNTASMVEMVSLYGYSYSSLVLGCLVCIVPVSALRWLVMLVLGGWSVFVLEKNFWDIVYSSQKTKKLVILVVLGLGHLLIVLLANLFFFK